MAIVDSGNDNLKRLWLTSLKRKHDFGKRLGLKAISEAIV
jgi:hypothetical protein